MLLGIGGGASTIGGAGTPYGFGWTNKYSIEITIP